VECALNGLFWGIDFHFVTVIYLLKLPNLGPWVDGIIGGAVGFISWIVWVYIFGNDWPTWSAPLTASSGALIFILLRSFIRRSAALFRWAGCLIKLVLVFAALGLIFWFIQNAL
jgi:hypothetical protein